MTEPLATISCFFFVWFSYIPQVQKKHYLSVRISAGILSPFPGVPDLGAIAKSAHGTFGQQLNWPVKEVS